jgi:ferredoxin
MIKFAILALYSAEFLAHSETKTLKIYYRNKLLFCFNFPPKLQFFMRSWDCILKTRKASLQNRHCIACHLCYATCFYTLTPQAARGERKVQWTHFEFEFHSGFLPAAAPIGFNFAVLVQKAISQWPL